MCRFLKLALLVTAAVTMAVPNMAWTETPYQNPDKVLADIVEAPQTPWVSLSPNEAIMLMMEPPSLPSVAELAERELRLAGMRIKPQINGQSRTRPLQSLSVLDIESREQRKILGIPEGARIENTSWSPKGDKVLFTNTTSTGLELWVAELDKAKARPLTGPVVSMTGNISPVWLSDNETIVFARVPQGPREEPKEKMVPDGPVTQENLGKVAPARTYQDLLKNPHDEELFEFYMAAQMCRVDMKGKVTAIGEEGLLWDFNPSPDGNYILVETIHKPFSYLVPASRFPQRVEIFDLDGNLVREIVDLPLQESVPIAFGSVTTGPRRFAWRNDAAAELVWAEALDGGDAGKESELRDKVVALSAPFEGEPRELMKLSQRFGGITWGNDECALVYSWWWKTRNLKTWRLYPGGSSESEVLSDRSWEDRYGDPG
ncbi:MAG: S9 family peptidase, partial [Candidatus Eisenbacteria bacterium]|nr:S9 family peptidase [Candidatus Eisenbacteria bacterium]